MLNKGPFILDAIQVLSGIVTRMQGHVDKRTPLLRRLSVAGAMARDVSESTRLNRRGVGRPRRITGAIEYKFLSSLSGMTGLGPTACR